MRAIALTSVSFLALAAGGAMAEPAKPVTEIQELVVTANKRTERLQEVPAAVSALSEATLESSSVRSFADFARSIPSLSFSDYGTGRQKPAIRGVSVNTGAAAVGFYIDEAPLPATGGTLRLTDVDPNLFDLERVEVLRGPQGTLYGAGAMGGTIRLITHKPDPSRSEGRLRLTAQTIDGGGPGVQADVMSNMPLVEDRAAVRLTAWWRDKTGFIQRQVNGVAVQDNAPQEKTTGFRAAVEIRPTEALRLDASVMSERQLFNGFQTVTFGFANPSDRLVQNFLFNTAEPNRNAYTLANVTAELSLGAASLTSSTSYYAGSYAGSEETGALLAAFVGPTFPSSIPETNDRREFTQEVRIASSRTLRGLDWVVGGFYQRSKTHRIVDYVVPQYQAIVGTSLMFLSRGAGDAEQRALFGEITWHLGQAWAVTAGTRWYDVSSDSSNFSDGLFNGGPSTAPPTPSSARGWVRKLNVSWKANPDVLLYAQASEGFRPGFGRNPLIPACTAQALSRSIDPHSNEVRPDSVVNYEAGAKTGSLQGRLNLNAAVFRIKWSDVQLGVFLPCGFNVPSNAGQATSQGVELEANFQATNALRVGGVLSFTDAAYDHTTPGAPAQAGDPLLEVPKWQGSAYADLRFAAPWGFGGAARVEVQHTGPSLLFYDRTLATAPAPLRFRERPGLTLLNARLAFDRAPWEIALFGRNLTNDVQVVGFADLLGANLSDRPRFTVNPPRTVGLEIDRTF